MPTEPIEMYETFQNVVAVGVFLRERRLRRGLSQPKVAAKIGIHPSTLSRLESGKLKRNAEKLLRSYAKTLGLYLEVNYALRRLL